MYKEEGYQLMGAAFEVYNQLGQGMAEDVHQQCLQVELELRGIPFAGRNERTLCSSQCVNRWQSDIHRL
jgi:GxxExxY protein